MPYLIQGHCHFLRIISEGFLIKTHFSKSGKSVKGSHNFKLSYISVESTD